MLKEQSLTAWSLVKPVGKVEDKAELPNLLALELWRDWCLQPDEAEVGPCSEDSKHWDSAVPRVTGLVSWSFFFLFWWTDHVEQDAYTVPYNSTNQFNLQTAVQNK